MTKLLDDLRDGVDTPTEIAWSTQSRAVFDALREITSVGRLVGSSATRELYGFLRKYNASYTTALDPHLESQGIVLSLFEQCVGEPDILATLYSLSIAPDRYEKHPILSAIRRLSTLVPDPSAQADLIARCHELYSQSAFPQHSATTLGDACALMCDIVFGTKKYDGVIKLAFTLPEEEGLDSPASETAVAEEPIQSGHPENQPLAPENEQAQQQIPCEDLRDLDDAALCALVQDALGKAGEEPFEAANAAYVLVYGLAYPHYKPTGDQKQERGHSGAEITKSINYNPLCEVKVTAEKVRQVLKFVSENFPQVVLRDAKKYLLCPDGPGERIPLREALHILGERASKKNPCAYALERIQAALAEYLNGQKAGDLKGWIVAAKYHSAYIKHKGDTTYVDYDSRFESNYSEPSGRLNDDDKRFDARAEAQQVLKDHISPAIKEFLKPLRNSLTSSRDFLLSEGSWPAECSALLALSETLMGQLSASSFSAAENLTERIELAYQGVSALLAAAREGADG